MNEDFPISTVLGYPRIGPRRELKRALEDYWAGRIDRAALDETGRRLRAESWHRLHELGLAGLPSNTFSLYDHVLDTAVAVDAVPDRYRDAADPYFAMARGTDDVPALRMTKWFDTNYHYIVPEIGPRTRFRAVADKPLAELREARELGYETRPVLLGPVTFLQGHLERLDDLLDVYGELLRELAEAGARWVQLDEPALVVDGGAPAVRHAYRRLAALERRPKLLVAPYFGDADAALPALSVAPVDGVAVDLTHGVPANLRLFEGRTVVGGVVSGRNVWRTDLDAARWLLAQAGATAVSTSCSLLHVPYTLRGESDLPAGLVDRLAFAEEKVAEVVALAGLGPLPAKPRADTQSEHTPGRLPARPAAETSVETTDGPPSAQQIHAATSVENEPKPQTHQPRAETNTTTEREPQSHSTHLHARTNRATKAEPTSQTTQLHAQTNTAAETEPQSQSQSQSQTTQPHAQTNTMTEAGPLTAQRPRAATNTGAGAGPLTARADGEAAADVVPEGARELVECRSPYAVRVAAQADLGLPALPVTTIGSFPQTGDLRAARATLPAEQYEIRIRREIDRVIAEQEALGLDVLVHGEPERNDMVQYFAEHLEGFAVTRNGWVQSYGSRCTRPPILHGDVHRPEPITVRWATYAQSRTERPVKGMLTGPVTIVAWSFVRSDRPLRDVTMQVADAVRAEVRDLEAAGIRIIQVDEPALRELLPLRREEQPEYLAWAVAAYRRATAGAADGTQIHTHLCYSDAPAVLAAIDALDADVTSIEAARSGFAIEGLTRGVGPGVYDIHSPRIPGVDEVGSRLRAALEVIPAGRLWVNPDCGLKTRTYEEVRAALTNVVAAAHKIRESVR
ncbi:5-methyltetrahydropteroyltriglutamate--homocysteine S-methyltransferase [Dactylosporangium sp. CA-052675]|uniref:5-methyltetrahydropteroyltriglutamate-- homocysteine S-methyltransferase n=1 Tax=Dactylosporangium sp. CA-052675 TaxID=3239927 RepID=UPI003D908BDB